MFLGCPIPNEYKPTVTEQ